MKLKEENQILRNELGRYEKAVQTRDMVIKGLRDDVAGNFEVQQLLATYIGLLVKQEGTVKVSKQEISDSLGKYRVGIVEKDGFYELSVITG